MSVTKALHSVTSTSNVRDMSGTSPGGRRTERERYAHAHDRRGEDE